MKQAPVWQLHPQVRLRRTPGGGAVFLPETAASVELSTAAFTAVSLLAAPHDARGLRRRLIAGFHRNFTLAEVDVLLRELAERNVLGASSWGTAPSPVSTPPSLKPAPESVHLGLNNVCNLRCPSCYAALRQNDAGALPLERIRALMDEWADMGVFQLALGGGEPLLSSRFAPVARLARQRGIVPNVTTNGWLITEALLDQARGSVGEWRISLNDAVTLDLPLIESRAALLRARGARFGFHLIVTRRNLDRLPDLLSWACAQRAATINLIRPKPGPGNRKWYRDNALRAADAARLGSTLNRLEGLFTQTALCVDCALSFLFHGQPAGELQARGVAGCALGDRFATIKWNGDVYPCSHLHGEAFKAGNVLTESFREIWEQSKVFTRVRRELARTGGSCGGCAHRPFCKGCRAMAWQQTGDWLATDPGCPFKRHVFPGRGCPAPNECSVQLAPAASKNAAPERRLVGDDVRSL